MSEQDDTTPETVDTSPTPASRQAENFPFGGPRPPAADEWSRIVPVGDKVLIQPELPEVEGNLPNCGRVIAVSAGVAIALESVGMPKSSIARELDRVMFQLEGGVFENTKKMFSGRIVIPYGNIVAILRKASDT
jgi:hypothetical protein